MKRAFAGKELVGKARLFRTTCAPEQGYKMAARSEAKDGAGGARKPQYHIFCDMDGVLVDFNDGVFQLCGKTPEELPNIQSMWKVVARKNNFFEDLKWTSDGRELWDALRQFKKVDMLTGVPSNRPYRHGHFKALWCRRELDRGYMNHVDMAAQKPQRHAIVKGKKRKDVVNVISCWSKFKWMECKGPHSILIDDRQPYQAAWERAGGIFILHTSTKDTLDQLRSLGILEAEEQVAPSEDEEPSSARVKPETAVS